MRVNSKSAHILVVDDDHDDCKLIQEAFLECKFAVDFKFAHNGEELFQYLDSAKRRPDLIILDLKMHKKNGRETLEEIKANKDYRSIPIVIMTTSSNQADIAHAYNHGATSYITKPLSFVELVDVVRRFGEYWFHTVTLPNSN